jgi:hypothetical protein
MRRIIRRHQMIVMMMRIKGVVMIRIKGIKMILKVQISVKR